MIRSFGDRETEKIWNGKLSRKLPVSMQQVARRKLRMLNNAQDMNDLRIPPANRLEKLKGNWKGFYSIRINERWRVLFRWERGDANRVQIVDYH